MAKKGDTKEKDTGKKAAPQNGAGPGKDNTDQPGSKDSQDQSTGKSGGRSGSSAGQSKTEVKKLKSELQEARDRYLRLSAEFDNYRKRTMKEKVEMTKFAGEAIFLKMLPILDDLDRAIGQVQQASDLEAIKQGMTLINNKFKEYLDNQGISEIDAMHQEFDTDLHEAVTKIPAPDKKLKGRVVDVIEKGYLLNEKVIRYAKVVIGE